MGVPAPAQLVGGAVEGGGGAAGGQRRRTVHRARLRRHGAARRRWLRELRARRPASAAAVVVALAWTAAGYLRGQAARRDVGVRLPAADAPPRPQRRRRARAPLRPTRTIVRRAPAVPERAGPAGRRPPTPAPARHELRPPAQPVHRGPGARLGAAVAAVRARRRGRAVRRRALRPAPRGSAARAPLVLEIGSGTGESTAAQAAAAPDVDHLAVEVFEPGLAQLLMRIDEAGLTNLRLLRGDAVDLLRERVPPGLAGRDPDLLPRSVAQAASPQAAPGPARVRRARPRPGLFPAGRCTLPPTGPTTPSRCARCARREPLLANTASTPDGWTPRPPWRPVTKFERRARGRRPRRPRPRVPPCFLPHIFTHSP